MKVLFAEPDKMFRLIAGALDPAQAEARFLGAFFLTESADPRTLVLDWARRRQVPADLTVAIAQDADMFAAELADADVVVLEKQPLTKAMLDAAPKLRLVQVFGGDASAVDLAACRTRGIEVRTLRRNTNLAVAEHTLMLMLVLVHNVDAARRSMTAPSELPPGTWAYNWPACPGVRGLAGRTVGLVGMGEVAQLVAEYLRPMGVRVVYTRRHRDELLEGRLGITFVDLPTLLKEADIVSLHVPGDARDLIDTDALARMKPGAILVNTARGSVVDEAALVTALRSGRLGGAGLDVFAVEPLPLDHAFHTLPNVVLTPHLAAGSRDAAWLDVEIGPVVDAVIAAAQVGAPSRSRADGAPR